MPASPQPPAARLRARALALSTAIALCCVCAPRALAQAASPDLSADSPDADSPHTNGPDATEPALTLAPVQVDGGAQATAAASARDALWIKRLSTTALAEAGESLAEGLQRSPGLTVRALGGGLQPREVMIRGASGRQTLITFEGVRLNSASGGAFDLSLLPEGIPGAVEVQRGGGEVLFGSGAQGGVVSVRVLEGVRAQATPGQPVGRVQAGGGGGLPEAFGWGWLATDVGGGVQVGAGVGARTVWGGFDFIDGQGTQRRRENIAGTQGSGWAAAQGAWGALRARLVHLSGWTARGFAGPAEFPKQFARASLEEGLSVTAARVEWALARAPWGAVEVAAQGSWRSASQHYTNPTALIGGHAWESRYQEGTWEAEASAAFVSPWLEVRAGGVARGEALTRAVGAALGEEARVVGAGFIWAQAWLWGERVELGAGARLEGAEGVDAAWVPRGALGLRPWRWLLLQGSVGGKLRLPAFDELYLRTEFVRGSPDLRPERGWHIDGGLRLEPSPDLWLEAAAFFMRHDDLILFIPTSALSYEARNLTGAQTVGVEVEALWRPHPSLSLGSAYTWTDARLVSDPQPPLPGRPAHQWDAVLTWALAPSAQVSVGARYTGERFLDAFGKRPQPGWWWMTAGATWQATPAWALGARANNLLNVQDAVDALQQPLPGLTWQLWARWAPFDAP
jgi:outer membrane receptor protein involved in Fe transport